MASGGKQIEELGHENNGLRQTVDHLERTNQELNDSVKTLKRDLASVKQELKAAQARACDSESLLAREHQNFLDRLNNDHSDLENQLNEHIAKLNYQIETAADTITENEATIAKLEKQLHASQRALAEQAEHLTELEQTHRAEIHQLTNAARFEKENLTQTYEAAIAELTKQYDGHRKDLEIISRDRSETESRNQKARSIILALKRERLQLQNAVESLTTKGQRDAEVSRALVRNAELTAESLLAQKLEDAKAQYESEKRRLFSLAADEFRSFFNAADSIDERSYRQLLGRVKNELRKLSETDVVVRRLVGAAPKQSTDDAVVHLLGS
jgi:chromosome segregation ATPase